MTLRPSFGGHYSWAIVFVLSLIAAYGSVETVRLSLEHSYKEVLATETTRRAIEVTAQTLNGNVMGSMSALGLIHLRIKKVAAGEIPPHEPSIMEALRAVGQSYLATGVFVVSGDGIVQSSWDDSGKSSTGLDVRFRPYFQISMQGKQNVYAAVSLATGERALYFAAPVYGESSSDSPVIGAMVARLGLERIDTVMKAWSGPALLVSPQAVTFASNRADWIANLAGERTAEQLEAIRNLKQFGQVFENGTPHVLPFDVSADTARIEGHRYALARAAVQWNDPNGDWELVLLGDLDEVMPSLWRRIIGLSNGLAVLGLGGLFVAWRRRLQEANRKRQRAETELRSYTSRLEADSALKSYLAEMANDLHQAGSLAEFAQRFMFHIAPKTEVHYGAFYALEEESQRLMPIGGYGALAGELEAIDLGQGLVGQCAKDMTTIAISDPAQTGIRILWGEGAAEPQSIIFLPTMHGGRCLGVIVLASLRPIDEEKRAILDMTLPMVAVNLEILQRNLGMQRQAEALKEQQTYLQETEGWYRGIIESAPDGMLVADETGTIIIANRKIEALFGYDAGALTGQNIEVLVPASARLRHVGLRENFMHGGETREMGALNKQLLGVRRDGSEIKVAVGLSRLSAPQGRGSCVCASVRDVTLSGKFVQLAWQPAYESGHPVIDGQHRALFALANDLLSAVLFGRSTEETAALIDALVRDVAQHFHDEETAFRTAGYPGADEHAMVHRELADRVVSLVRSFRAGTLGIGELFQFLAYEVVVQHMLGDDRKYVPYLKGRAPSEIAG